MSLQEEFGDSLRSMYWLQTRKIQAMGNALRSRSKIAFEQHYDNPDVLKRELAQIWKFAQTRFSTLHETVEKICGKKT